MGLTYESFPRDMTLVPGDISPEPADCDADSFLGRDGLGRRLGKSRLFRPAERLRIFTEENTRTRFLDTVLPQILNGAPLRGSNLFPKLRPNRADPFKNPYVRISHRNASLCLIEDGVLRRIGKQIAALSPAGDKDEQVALTGNVGIRIERIPATIETE